jgi:hypothetical protein
MPVFNIHHITRYEYEKPVKESVNEIRLFGLNCPEQEVLQQEIHITHQPDIQIYKDYYGNKVGLFSIPTAHISLQIESKILVRTIVNNLNPLDADADFDALNMDVADHISLLECRQYEAISKQSAIQEIADEVSIEIFAGNLKQLLLEAPIAEQPIMAIDPGFRSGCKLVVLNSQGDIEVNETIFPFEKQKEAVSNFFNETSTSINSTPAPAKIQPQIEEHEEEDSPSKRNITPKAEKN